jgi:hypothetical protein
MWGPSSLVFLCLPHANDARAGASHLSTQKGWQKIARPSSAVACRQRPVGNAGTIGRWASAPKRGAGVRHGHTRHQVTELACSVSVCSHRNQANPARTMLRGGQIDSNSIVGLLLQRWQIVIVGIRLVSGCTAASSVVGFLLGGRQLGLEPPAPQRRGRGVDEHRQGHGVGVRARPRCGANEHEPSSAWLLSTSRRARLGRFTCHCCSHCLQPSSGDLSSVTLFK